MILKEGTLTRLYAMLKGAGSLRLNRDFAALALRLDQFPNDSVRHTIKIPLNVTNASLVYADDDADVRQDIPILTFTGYRKDSSVYWALQEGK